MLVDDEKKNIGGRFAGPSPAASISIVVAVIESRLAQFSAEYTGTEIDNEKGLTQKFCILLNAYAINERYPFHFEKEYMEEPSKGNSPQVDIGTISNRAEGIVVGARCYSQRESFFSLEAKRLYKASKAREKEYLVGRWENNHYIDTGGVERFKKGIHGKILKYAAIIGYVQSENFEYWHRKINSWIGELINRPDESTVKWTVKDRLIENHISPKTAHFKSENQRENDYIYLFHLWVNLVSLQPS